MELKSITLESKLEKLIKKDNFCKYILESVLEELELSAEEKNFVDEFLFKKGIEIRLDDLDVEKAEQSFSDNKYVFNEDYVSQLEKFSLLKDSSLSEFERNKIRDELIENNMRLVPYISHEYAIKTGMDIRELNSYGYEGLIIAVDSYDISLGNAFSTYAYFKIKGAILNGIKYISGFKRQETWFYKYIVIKNEIETILMERIEDNPNIAYKVIDEMKKRYNLSEKLSEYLLNNVLINTLSIVKYGTLFYNMDTKIFADDLKLKVSELLSELSDREAEILRYRFGLEGYSSKALSEIGKMYGLSKERVRQIEQETFEKIKRSSLNKKIKAYY